jgi:hypothetical protein
MTALVTFAQDFQQSVLATPDRFGFLEAPQAQSSREAVGSALGLCLFFFRPTIRADTLSESSVHDMGTKAS